LAIRCNKYERLQDDNQGKRAFRGSLDLRSSQQKHFVLLVLQCNAKEADEKEAKSKTKTKTKNKIKEERQRTQIRLSVYTCQGDITVQ
jgi:phage tail tube protein FII